MNDCSKEMGRGCCTAAHKKLPSLALWHGDSTHISVTGHQCRRPVFYWSTRPFHQLVLPHLALDAIWGARGRLKNWKTKSWLHDHLFWGNCKWSFQHFPKNHVLTCLRVLRFFANGPESSKKSSPSPHLETPHCQAPVANKVGAWRWYVSGRFEGWNEKNRKSSKWNILPLKGEG